MTKSEKVYEVYTKALKSLGIETEGKDLLEVIAALAEELTSTKEMLYDFITETRDELYDLQKLISK